MSRASRFGFTLTELVVVMAVIAIMMALLLPAIQAAREAARRFKCQNNLRQLALAIQNYHATFDQLPASGIVAPSAGRYEPRSGNQFSWIVLILKQLEEGPLHDQFRFDVPVFMQPQEPQAVQFHTLLCPSDSARGQFFEDPQLTRGKAFGKGNYAAYVSPFHVENQNRFPGALIANRRHSMSQIVDGTSNTLLLSEVLTRAHPRDQRGAWALPWTGSSQLSFDLHHVDPDFSYGGSGGYRPDVRGLGLNQPPNNQGPNVDMLYACPDRAGAQVGKMPCNVWTAGTSLDYLSAAPRSWHPGGVNVAFADGHLGFLPNSVDPLAMAYMVSIEDGQPVSVDEHVK